MHETWVYNKRKRQCNNFLLRTVRKPLNSLSCIFYIATIMAMGMRCSISGVTSNNVNLWSEGRMSQIKKVNISFSRTIPISIKWIAHRKPMKLLPNVVRIKGANARTDNLFWLWDMRCYLNRAKFSLFEILLIFDVIFRLLFFRKEMSCRFLRFSNKSIPAPFFSMTTKPRFLLWFSNPLYDLLSSINMEIIICQYKSS